MRCVSIDRIIVAARKQRKAPCDCPAIVGCGGGRCRCRRRPGKPALALGVIAASGAAPNPASPRSQALQPAQAAANPSSPCRTYAFDAPPHPRPPSREATPRSATPRAHRSSRNQSSRANCGAPVKPYLCDTAIREPATMSEAYERERYVRPQSREIMRAHSRIDLLSRASNPTACAASALNSRGSYPSAALKHPPATERTES